MASWANVSAPVAFVVLGLGAIGSYILCGEITDLMRRIEFPWVPGCSAGLAWLGGGLIIVGVVLAWRG